VCGYHIGYGIITSEEWKAVVAPMAEKVPEDVLHGAFAVFTAWAGPRPRSSSSCPAKVVVRAYDSYQADVVEAGASHPMSACMIQGGCAAFMDLAYGKPYPVGFACTQTKGIETVDDYGKFVVTHAKAA
jgi:hypothetical protein